MTQLRFLTATLLLLGLVLSSSSQAAAIPRDVSLAPLVEQVSPAVVNISTRGTVTVRRSPMMDDPFFRRFFGDEPPTEREFEAAGSGVIIDARNGYLLTNNHVVDSADEITVRLVDGRELSAEVVGTDARSDVAVLKVEGDNLTELPIGNSESLQVGDYVLAIGNPFGLGGTVTSGIVSAKGRSGRNILGLSNGQPTYEDFIQTDASINSGNSGGALINLQGELIGINTAILGRGGGSVGIGFAIPSNMARQVMEQILEHGSVSRGLLGVTGNPRISPELAAALGLGSQRGALVSSVLPDSAAEEAGLREYDVIIEANGRQVEDFDDLRNVIGFVRPGQEVRLKVVRDGRTRVLSATIRGDNNATAASDPAPATGPDPQQAVAGASLSDLPSNHPLYGEVEGVMVAEVPRGSEAEKAGLLPYDVITSINRRPVRSLDQAIEVLNSNERNVIKVRRRQSTFITVLG